jgi:NitT/TauT family transport system permease protein
MGSTTPHKGSRGSGRPRRGAGRRDAAAPAGLGKAPGATAPQGVSAARPPVARHTRLLFAASGVAAILVGWQLLALWVDPVYVASPADTAKALGRLAWGSTLWVQLLITLKRLVIGLAIGVTLGWVMGMFAGLEPRLRSFLEPMRWLGMTVPAVIIAAMAMIWFGLGDFTVIFMVALIVLPTMYVNTVAGVLNIDPRLAEMGRVYHFPRRLLLTEIYLPGAASPALAGLTLAAGIGVRAVILGEVLGAMSGIGHSFSRAMSYLETPDLFAWIVVLLVLMALLEFGVLRPLKRRVMRWRKVAE